MRKATLLFATFALMLPAASRAAESITIPVDSQALVFSPGTWTGDEGRSGKRFRQTWNPGAYFRVTWETSSRNPVGKLLFDTSTYPRELRPPLLAYCLDGVWKSKIPCSGEVPLEAISGPGRHELEVFLHQSQQVERWGCEGKSGVNVVRVTGLELDAQSKPAPSRPASKWALIVGDSITEGSGATELAPWSHLVGEALQTQGYEYGVSACGWSGWINRGDNPPGDVPGYYVVRNSVNGAGGQYDDAASRWNKIDGNRHSLLDARGRLSAYGATGQEPALILINYGTNDALHKSNPSDTRASMVQALGALRRSAPEAQIIVIVPFGQYYARELHEAVEIHKKSNPADARIALVDLGPSVARTLAAKSGLLGGLHPNDRGHAIFAARLIPQIMAILQAAK